jgi:hypothetical protein
VDSIKDVILNANRSPALKNGRLAKLLDVKPKQLELRAIGDEILNGQTPRDLGFIARVMAQVSLPYRKTEEQVFIRTNGRLQLRISSWSGAGIPYGSVPRVLLAWTTSEAARTKSPRIHLGRNLTEFLHKIKMERRGGPRGDITRVKEQARRLFTSTVAVIADAPDQGYWGAGGVQIADECHFWWNSKHPDQFTLWESHILLTERFFKGIIDHPVPFDWRAVAAIKESALALDIYWWLTHRFSYLKKPSEVPWSALQGQFGSQYADTPQGRQGFKRKFLEQLRNVIEVYPHARVRASDNGLLLQPSPRHVLST